MTNILISTLLKTYMHIYVQALCAEQNRDSSDNMTNTAALSAYVQKVMAAQEANVIALETHVGALERASAEYAKRVREVSLRIYFSALHCTVGFIFMWSGSSTISIHITSITHKHQTDIYPQTLTFTAGKPAGPVRSGPQVPHGKRGALEVTA